MKQAGENSNLFFCNLPSIWKFLLPDTKWKILSEIFVGNGKRKNAEMGGV